MFDVICYPVSAILWFWHTVFGTLLDPASGITWALSVVFLVFTLRALLFKPFVHQVRSMKKMSELAPRIRALQEAHGDDRQKLAQEMQKLQSEQGFNPLSGCLPVLVQVPVFIGLFHVLNGFRPGAPSNFVFGPEEVASFVGADFFGATLSNSLNQSADVLAAFGTDRASMLSVGIPLMLLAAVATHFTARHSVSRQTADAAAQPQAAMMNRMTLWIFPAFAIVGGPFLPLAILIYWLANNFWTLLQQRLVYRKIDREEAAQASSQFVVESTAVWNDSSTEPSTAAQPSPAVIDSVAAQPGDADQPGDATGETEDRSRDTDKLGEDR